jgi:hypothetical protein
MTRTVGNPFIAQIREHHGGIPERTFRIVTKWKRTWELLLEGRASSRRYQRTLVHSHCTYDRVIQERAK